ncbi:MAG: hypothetical protein HOM21_13230 [Halobacteriovoraceae bacterium]|nr:hypothetical protein [Halobacteriovoraceae bacterium]
MKTMLLILLVLLTTPLHALTLSQKYELASQRCTKPGPSEPHLYSSEFHWNMTVPELNKIFPAVYNSGKRLKHRAYFEAGFKLPHIPNQKTTLLTENFIKSLITQVEEAHRRGYVDALIFPDMGHSHFFIPQEFYDRELNAIPVSDYHLFYQKLLAHKELRILYHTAEQLKMTEEGRPLADRHLGWRFYTRNLVGRNDQSKILEIIHAPETRANTTHNYRPGYKYWGAGFNISASIDGCFPYEVDGKLKYFDLSFEDLTSEPGAVFF